MNRRERESAILQIIRDEPVATQQELVDALSRRGLDVTQATVSRDIKRLGLVKAPLTDGTYRYHPPEDPAPPAPAAFDEMREALGHYATGITRGSSLLVIRTQPGAAHTVAIAIDQARVPGVAGTIAGDDTILLVLESESARRKVLEEFESLLG